MRTAALLFAAFTASCNGCSKDTQSSGDAAPSPSGLVAEALPRCRPDSAHVVIPGEDVIVGDAAVSSAGLLLGVVRRDGQKRIGSIVRVPLDLSSMRVIDVAPVRGDGLPPSPRWNGTSAFVAYHVRSADAGWTRELKLARLDEGALGAAIGSLSEQNDESTAFDLAWTDGEAAPLVAWDEDAPPKGDGGIGKGIERGFVKVKSLPDGKFRVASPEGSDAELPRLLPRPGGFWLAWLARKIEETQGNYDEGPGEKRAFRWVEVVALDARGEPTSAVRRASPTSGRAVSFELAINEAGQLVVVVQDEAAAGEGAGGKIVRHVLGGDRVESSEVVDGGVGHAIAELAPIASAGTARWLAWNDGNDRVHLVPLGGKLAPTAASTHEASLEGARVIGAAGSEHVYAVVQKPPSTELRRFLCK